MLEQWKIIEQWNQLPSIIDEMDLWGASVDQYQFVLSHDRKFKMWCASCKLAGNKGPRRDLGEFRTRIEAVASAELFLEKLQAGLETL